MFQRSEEILRIKKKKCLSIKQTLMCKDLVYEPEQLDPPI